LVIVLLKNIWIEFIPLLEVLFEDNIDGVLSITLTGDKPPGEADT